MSYGKVLVTLVFLGFVFIGCSSKPDISQFVTKESFDKETVACRGSADILCSNRPAIRKVKKYCSDNKLSDSQCEELNNAVMEEMVALTEIQSKRIQEATDKMRETTEEQRRKLLK
jgi:hypothetical protein